MACATQIPATDRTRQAVKPAFGAESLLLAPGSLFSPSQLPSTRMRINVAAMQDPVVWEFLERELAKGQGRG